MTEVNASIKQPIRPTELDDVGYEAGHVSEDIAYAFIQKPPVESTSKSVVATSRVDASSLKSSEVHGAPIPVVGRIERPILENRPSVDSVTILSTLKERIGFEEQNDKMGILPDVLGARYLERLIRGGQKTGKTEAASYGVGEINEEKIAVFALNWDFMGGSTGVVAGEKFREAVELAIKEKIPLIGYYSSGGIRQDENFPALRQMSRMVASIADFRQNSSEPYIAVLSHMVYGGISASVVPLADIKVGFTGTDFGFAGPNIIQSYQKTEIPKGAQSAEVNYENRQIDFLVRDEDEMYQWMSQLLHHSRHGKEGRLHREAIKSLPEIKELSDSLRFRFDERGFSSLVTDTVPPEITQDEKFGGSEMKVNTEDLFTRYDAHQTNPYRPDTEYLLRQIFNDVVPLYGKVSNGKMLSYPAIIAALGRIGDQSYLVIGDQPSYQVISGKVRKIPASPSPEDFSYLKRMLLLGNRLDIPALLLTDTFGAKPTIQAEESGQSMAIAEALYAGTLYKPPLISINLGMLGSGGGLATTPFSDREAMLENSFAFVAEGKSSAIIKLKKPEPTREEIAEHIEQMQATAQEQFDLKLTDKIIEEPDNAWQNPAGTASNIRSFIVDTTLELQEMSDSSRLKKRRDKIKNFPGLPLHRE